jgi:hypothetical protein
MVKSSKENQLLKIVLLFGELTAYFRGSIANRIENTLNMLVKYQPGANLDDLGH